MKRLLQLLLLTTVLVALLPIASASAYSTLGCKFNASGNSLKWQDSTTNSGYSTVAAPAVNAWSATSTQINITKVNSGANIRVTNGNFGAEWMGVSFAGVTLDSSQRFPTVYSCSGGTWDTAMVSWWNTHYADNLNYTQRQIIMVHEVGHALGLAHTYNPDCNSSVMAEDIYKRITSSCVGKVSSTPRPDDADGVNAIY